MRACFIDHGNNPNYALLRKHSIQTVLIPGEESPAANPTSVKQAADEGFQVEIMFAWNWHGFGYRTGKAFAEYASERLKAIGHPQVNPTVLFDIEKGAGLTEFTYVDWVVDCLTRWRQLRPTRGTSLTLEAMQGGLFNGRGDAVAKILNMVGGVIPQYYTGDERPMAQDVALKDLMLYGFPHTRVRGFYLARELPINWDGYAWTQGKLPA